MSLAAYERLKPFAQFGRLAGDPHYLEPCRRSRFECDGRAGYFQALGEKAQEGGIGLAGFRHGADADLQKGAAVRQSLDPGDPIAAALGRQPYGQHQAVVTLAPGEMRQGR